MRGPHPDERGFEPDYAGGATSGRPVVLVQLITTAALAVCTAVAATAVSIGMARAATSGDFGADSLALKLFILGVILAGLGRISILICRSATRG